jgi:hypothetical protein
MVSLSSIKLDTSSVSEGVWKKDPWGIGFEMCIASATSPEFVRAMREAARLRDADGEDGHRKRVGAAFARYILKGWRGLEDGDAPLPYSFDNALPFFVEENCAHIREWVAVESQATGEYLVKSRAEAGKG